MRKKVLHLITGVELGGGAENMLLQLLPNMKEDLDNRVCAIMGRGEIGKKLESKGIKVYYLDLKSIFDLGVIFHYRGIIKKFDPDIQVNYLIHADLFGRILGKIFGVKIIVAYIRNIHKQKKMLMFLDKMTLSLSDFVLTNSETARKYYIENMGSDKDKTSCIPNGLDLEKIKKVKVNKKEKLKELGIPENRIIIGSIARLEPQKDIGTLIEAFSLVLAKHKECHLIVVGHGSEKDKMKKLAKALGISSKVTFLEKRKDVLELLRIFDIFVLPSLNEGMSNALLEAMASKNAIITSDIPENVELIKDEEDGLNFKAGESGDLNTKIHHLIENEDDCQKYIKNSFYKIKNNYQVDLIRSDFKNFLLNI